MLLKTFFEDKEEKTNTHTHNHPSVQGGEKRGDTAARELSELSRTVNTRYHHKPSPPPPPPPIQENAMINNTIDNEAKGINEIAPNIVR